MSNIVIDCGVKYNTNTQRISNIQDVTTFIIIEKVGRNKLEEINK